VRLALRAAPRPPIHSHSPRTHHWFLRLVTIVLGQAGPGHIATEGRDQAMGTMPMSPMPPDVPDVPRCVPVLHLIPTPFPRVWHTLGDTEDNLHPPTVQDLAKILVVFVAEFLQL
ncbi:QPCTL protein, partial [Eulacestoma nigropectus]|nr:QPCTL protein [Eulacestoma nigropectus]